MAFSSQENTIKDLYEGEIKDYVRCLACGNESSRSVRSPFEKNEKKKGGMEGERDPGRKQPYKVLAHV